MISLPAVGVRFTALTAHIQSNLPILDRDMVFQCKHSNLYEYIDCMPPVQAWLVLLVVSLLAGLSCLTAFNYMYYPNAVSRPHDSLH
jgi:hypothetical protein